MEALRNCSVEIQAEEFVANRRSVRMRQKHPLTQIAGPHCQHRSIHVDDTLLSAASHRHDLGRTEWWCFRTALCSRGKLS